MNDEMSLTYYSLDNVDWDLALPAIELKAVMPTLDMILFYPFVLQDYQCLPGPHSWFTCLSTIPYKVWSYYDVYSNISMKISGINLNVTQKS